MDVANKTEKIAAPSGKHDDFCDSSVIGIHATLSMLPSGGTFGSSGAGSSKPRALVRKEKARGYSGTGLFTTRRGSKRLNKLGFKL